MPDPAEATRKDDSDIEKLSFVHFDEDEEDTEVLEEKHMTYCLKPTLCWCGALLIWASELFIHIRCGFDKHALEDEEAGICIQNVWTSYLAVCEAICRSGLAIVLAGLVCETSFAIFKSRLCSFLKLQFFRSKKPDQRNVCFQIGKLSVPLFTLGMGIWSTFESAPEWVAIYAHVCDIFCHTVVTTAIIGFIYDVCSATHRKELLEMIMCFLTCHDDFESYGLQGGHRPTPRAADVARHSSDFHLRQQKARYDVIRTLVMWLVFIFVLTTYIISLGKELPAPFKLVLDCLNISCWVTISWALLQGLSSVRRSFFRRAMTWQLSMFLVYSPDQDDAGDEDTSSSESDSEEIGCKVTKLQAICGSDESSQHSSSFGI